MEKSAEVKIPMEMSCGNTTDGLTGREGPNVNFFEIRIGIRLGV
tara:strand:- start:8062 stop:8193 length:132 start_codon:yes stop_codon:yes gene_type:complete